MARYLNVPITGIQPNIGYLPPFEWWNAELERKNRIADEGQAVLDAIGATTFQYLDPDKANAQTKLAEWKSKEEELAKLYMQDPVKAAVELNKTKRQLTRELSTPGEFAYEAQTGFNTIKSLQEQVDKLKDKMPIEQWYNIDRQLKNYTGITKNPDGTWTGANFAGLMDFPDLPVEIDNILKNMDPTGTSGFKSWYDPSLGKTVVEKTNVKGKTEEDVKTSIIEALKLKYGEFLPGFVEYHKEHYAPQILETIAEDKLSTEKAIETIQAQLKDPKLSATQKNTLENKLTQLSKKDFTDVDQYAQDSFINSLIQFGTAQHANDVVEKSRDYIEAAENSSSGTKTKLPSITGISPITVNARTTPKLDLNIVQKENKENKLLLDQTQQLLNQGVTKQAQLLGFNFQDTGLIPTWSPNDQSVETFINTTKEINQLLNQELDQASLEQAVTDIINTARKNIGGKVLDKNGFPTENEFKFDNSYTYNDFERDHLKLAETFNQLQTQKEAQRRSEIQRENLFKSVADQKPVFAGAGYNENIIVPGGTGTIREPEQGVLHNMWSNYLGIDNENDYKQFLIDNNDATSDDLLELNQKLAKQGEVKPLVPGQYMTKVVLSGLASRIKILNDNTNNQIKASPELLNPLSEIIVFTKGSGKETEDAIKSFSTNVGTMFKDLKLIQTLYTPDGKTIEEALAEKSDDININTINPALTEVYPVINPIGNTPTLLVKFFSYSPDNKVVDPVPVEVALNYGPDGKIKETAIADQLDILTQSILSSTDDSPQALQLKEAAKSFIGHRLFAPGIHNSWIDVTPNPAVGKETTPISIGELQGKDVSLSKDSDGTYQIYFNNVPSYKTPKERLKRIEDVYYNLGSFAYTLGELPDSGIFTSDEAQIAQDIFSLEAGEQGYRSIGQGDNPALGGFQFKYSHHQDLIRKGLEDATGVKFTDKTKYNDQSVQESFLNNETAQKYTMKTWLNNITPTANKLQEILINNNQPNLFTPSELYYIIHREGEQGAINWLTTFLTTGEDTYTQDNNYPLLEAIQRLRNED